MMIRAQCPPQEDAPCQAPGIPTARQRGKVALGSLAVGLPATPLGLSGHKAFYLSY